MSETARSGEYTTSHSLFLAFELSSAEWELAFSTGLGQSARRRAMSAGDLTALNQEVRAAKRRFGLGDSTDVRSCYEAGRDGFWLHRHLTAVGIENVVVDPSSVEVSRRAKQTKTDRLDVEKLLNMLMRYHNGEKEVWSVVHVPSVVAEDWRHLHRELLVLKARQTRHSNRIQGLLATQGLRLSLAPDFPQRLCDVRLWDGSALPPGLRRTLEQEYRGLQFVHEQICQLETERSGLIRTSQDPCMQKVRQLLALRGIGENSAWLFVMEFFAWREFRNRREVGALAGLTPTPYASGEQSREQGISKSGNRLIRAMAIEIAWGWLRHQPDSILSQWFEERFGHGSRRMRKVGIVAVARKLLISLWQYLETGAIPEGAQLKA